jgi:hypothetical protein
MTNTTLPTVADFQKGKLHLAVLEGIVSGNVKVTTPEGTEHYSLSQYLSTLSGVVSGSSTVISPEGIPHLSVKQLTDEFHAAIRKAGDEPINGGIWAAGVEFTAYNQYMVKNGVTYKPKKTTTLPYVTRSDDPTYFSSTDGDYVQPFEIETLDLHYFTIIDAGYTEAEYLATPIAVLNGTLQYMLGFGGGILVLPKTPVTVKVSEETAPDAWGGFYKVIIPQVTGTSWIVVGHGESCPLSIDTSLLSGNEATGEWRLFNSGDQTTGKTVWDYRLDIGTDPADFDYDDNARPEVVSLCNVVINGDLPEASPNVVAVGSYDYQIAGSRVSAKTVIYKDLKVSRIVNTALTAAFFENAYFDTCNTSDIGHAKAAGQPANSYDVIGMGAKTGIRSVAVFNNCDADKTHDVAYMGIWSDVYLNNSRCKKTSIAAEHQAAWATTDITDIGGNWYINGCVLDCDIEEFINDSTDGRLGDAVVASGGCQKTMIIRDSVIKRSANMVVAGYMRSKGSKVILDNVTVIGCGWAGFTEFPCFLMSKGDLYVNGGRYIDLKHDIYQLISGGNLYAGDRTDLSGCSKNLISEKSAQSIAQIKVNVLDSVGMCRIGSSVNHAYDYDIDIRFEGHSGTSYVLLQTWDEKAVGISGKIKLDMNHNCPNMRPIVSYQKDTYGVIELEVENFDFNNVNVGNNWNNSYGFIHSDSLLHINSFDPLKSAIVGVDVKKCQTTAGSGLSNLSSLLSNVRSAYLTKHGLELSQASVMGVKPAMLPYAFDGFLQLNPNLITSALPATGWSIVMQVDSFDYRNLDDNKTRVRSLIYALETSHSTGSNAFSLSHWDAQGRDEVFLSIGGVNAYIDQDPTEDKITIGISYDGDSTCVLAVNGKAKSFIVGALPTFVDNSSAVYFGTNSNGFSSLSEYFDPRSGNCNLQKLAFIDKALELPFLERLTKVA